MTIEAALGNHLPVALMATLVGLKLLATSVTVGSGSAGGVIGPSLYLGAMLGGSIGVAFHALLPQFTATPGAYALVGVEPSRLELRIGVARLPPLPGMLFLRLYVRDGSEAAGRQVKELTYLPNAFQSPCGVGAEK